MQYMVFISLGWSPAMTSAGQPSNGVSIDWAPETFI